LTARVVELVGPLDEAKAHSIAAAIHSSAGRPIDLRIDSPGGVLFAAIIIAMAFEEHDQPIFTTVFGEACGAAFLVAIAADRRRIDRRGALMIHHPSPSSIDATRDVLEAIVTYSGQRPAAARAWMDREATFDAEAAKRAGLMDAIIDAAASEPVRLVPIPKRRPTRWLRSYRDLCERRDLRAVDALMVG
jgi:ATP-dependent protease ClpP protease subunit